LDAREVFPLSTGLWLARLISKHKSWRKQTNIWIRSLQGESRLGASIIYKFEDNMRFDCRPKYVNYKSHAKTSTLLKEGKSCRRNVPCTKITTRELRPDFNFVLVRDKPYISHVCNKHLFVWRKYICENLRRNHNVSEKVQNGVISMIRSHTKK
jgi:hypothetical protein